MLIIAGLGNPGSKYADNRHNIGFMAADEIVRRHSFGPWKIKHKAEVSQGTLDGEKILVVKRQPINWRPGLGRIRNLVGFFQIFLGSHQRFVSLFVVSHDYNLRLVFILIDL